MFENKLVVAPPEEEQGEVVTNKNNNIDPKDQLLPETGGNQFLYIIISVFLTVGITLLIIFTKKPEANH